MSRLIDADTLIKWINESRCADCPDKQEDRCAACQWDDVIMSIETAPTIGGWISVKDRLPEDGQEVVVRVIRGYFDVATYDALTKKWDTYEDAYEFERITHWMPLPEPPEEVSGDEKGC